MRIRFFAACLAAMSILCAGCGNNDSKWQTPEPVGPEGVTMQGELFIRLMQNLTRLQEEKYQPGNVFLTEEQSGGWPGDTEGRTILGLVCDARALGLEPKYLGEIIARIPEHLNSMGYMGPEYGDILNEQQLSGNGWMLRGLCAYYDWKRDEKILGWIKSISENLFVKGKGQYSTYPIDPSQRIKGEGRESGNITDISGHWMLSSDIGCLFIGMDGLIDAYRLVGTPGMKEVIDEMLSRFLEMDLVAIQAQTHASLTACRGLVRYSELSGDSSLIAEAAKRWELYKEYGMTENYENYNWFGRYDTWTEPCAIVDSYMLALKLWQHTGDTAYLKDAHLIYYNALCHTQRANGGFGCDSCPGEASGPELTVRTDEAHWCCTMRGAEGLATAAATAVMRSGNTFYITNFRQSDIKVDGLEIEIQTDYPSEGAMVMTVMSNPFGKDLRLKLFLPDWIIPWRFSVGENNIRPKVDEDGYLVLDKPLHSGDQIFLDYRYVPRQEETINKRNTRPGQVRYLNGPFILNEESKPIYHLMNPQVSKESGYHHKIIFK